MQPAAKGQSSTRLSWRARKPGRATGPGEMVLVNQLLCMGDMTQICRNFVGWPRWSSCRPNTAHLTLAAWERQGRLQHVVTQNVDQLHYKVIVACLIKYQVHEQTCKMQAGCRNVVELHGTNSLVTCMTCSFSIPRMTFQVRRRCF